METGICYYCDELFPIEDLRSVGSQLLCEGCQDDHTLTCARCDETFLTDDNAGTDSFPLCRNCYGESYTRCCRCDELLQLDQAYYTDFNDEEPLCYDCYCERTENEKCIKNYSYKPEPIFYGTGPRFMGIELEVDHGGFNNSNAKRLLDIANKDHELLYIKSDSSLDDGFELVSHAASLDYHMANYPWAELLQSLIGMNYLSHKAGTCGLHMHVSRNSFGRSYDSQEASIARVLYFIEKQFDELLIFSRRTQAQLDHWARRYGLKDTPQDVLQIAKHNSSNGRYAAVNLENASTLEFRLFRGTLKVQTLKATIQLVDSICQAAVSMDDQEMQALSWQHCMMDIDPTKKPELIEYLKTKRLFVNEFVDEGEEDL